MVNYAVAAEATSCRIAPLTIVGTAPAHPCDVVPVVCRRAVQLAQEVKVHEIPRQAVYAESLRLAQVAP